MIVDGTRNKVKPTELAKLFAAEPVDVAYLFGSVARGDTGPLSDVDVALLLRTGVSREAAFDLRLRMMTALGRAFDADEIDVIVLNDAPLLLQHRILRDGKVLFCRKAEIVSHDLAERLEGAGGFRSILVHDSLYRRNSQTCHRGTEGTEVSRCLSRNLCFLRLLLNNLECHLGFSSVYSVPLWLNDLS